MDGKLRNMATVYLLKGDRVLLLYRQGGRVVSDVWTGSAGGHFEKDELNDARACAEREMYEELGLLPEDTEGLSLRYVTLRWTNGEIRQNYYFFARLKEEKEDGLSSNEGISRWFQLEETEPLPMPLSARQMFSHYLKFGRFTKEIYVGITDKEQATFHILRET